MPVVNVNPTTETPSHDIALHTHGRKIGLQFAKGPGVLQEIPISDPAQPFSASQNSWVSGFGLEKFSDDPTGYWDSLNAWIMTDGKAVPTPHWKFATGNRSANIFQPDTNIRFVNFTSSYLQRAASFAPTENYDARCILLWLDYKGNPGTLTVALYSDSAGAPNTLLQSATCTKSNVTAGLPTRFVFTAESLVNGTTYWVVVTAASQNPNNHWIIWTDSTGSGLKHNGSTWESSAYKIFFHVSTIDVPAEWRGFIFQGSTYFVRTKDSGANSDLYIVGDRGKASSSTATTLTDSTSGVSSGWTTDQWVGATIRIYRGTGEGQIRAITANTSTQITVDDDWETNPDTTSQYIIYGTGVLQEITTPTGLGVVTGTPCRAGAVVYFPQGQSDPIRKMKLDYTDGTNHAFSDDSTNYADQMAMFHNESAGMEVWSTDAASSTVAHAKVVGYSGTLDFSTAIRIGTSDWLITNLVPAEDLWIFKEDSVWRIAKDYTKIRFNSGLGTATAPNNGKAAMVSDGEIWWGWSNSVTKTEGTSARDMLNYRVGSTGMIRGGQPVDCVAGVGWKFFAFDNEREANTSSSIMVFSGLGWSELVRGWHRKVRMRNVFWQPCPGGRPKLWFSAGADLCYMDFPLYASNPLNDTSLQYMPHMELISPTFEGTDITKKKLLNTVDVVLGGLSTNWRIFVDYQINDKVGSTSWRFLGNVRQLSAKEFPLNKGDVNQWRIRIRMQTKTTTDPPILEGYKTDGWQHEKLAYQWVGTFKVDSNQVTKDGEEDFDPNEIMDFLKDAFNGAWHVRLQSVIKSMNNKSVDVSAPHAQRNWVRAEDGREKWGGLISVAFRESR